jgi:hypothetical protein
MSNIEGYFKLFAVTLKQFEKDRENMSEIALLSGLIPMRKCPLDSELSSKS